MPRRSAARAASKPTTKLILKRKKLVPRTLASRRKLFTKRAIRDSDPRDPGIVRPAYRFQN